MNYVTGDTIRALREKKNLTQKELAERLMVSDKTVSKWETGRGLPDIGILTELAAVLDVSVPELLTGEIAVNRNLSANLKRARFYVCPVCGNVIFAMGEGAYSCCGIRLPALEEEAAGAEHLLKTEIIENELYVTADHPMEKNHYISFIAYVNEGTLQLQKLYPEQEVQVYFRRMGWGKLYAYCSRHGLVSCKV